MRKLIRCLILPVFLLPAINISAQISAGPLLGVNMSRTDNFQIDKEMLRPGIYGGLYGNYKVNSWFSAGLEAAWSEKSHTFYDVTKFSALAKLQGSLGMLIPNLPDLTEIIEMVTGLTGLTLNDTVFESRRGMVDFKAIEVPVTAQFSYQKFRIDLGGYVSFLTGAYTERTVKQDIPLFDVLPPETFNEISPFIAGFIYAAFPAYKQPQESNSSLTRDFASTDFGLIGGITYQPDDFLSFSLRYSHGLTDKLSPDLAESKTHSVFRLSVSYNLFGKVVQKPSF